MFLTSAFSKENSDISLEEWFLVFKVFTTATRKLGVNKPTAGLQEAGEEVKEVIGRLSKLRYEVQTDKAVLPLQSQAADVDVWNAELAVQTQSSQGRAPTWYSATWLYLECYMYRAINDYVAVT